MIKRPKLNTSKSKSSKFQLIHKLRAKNRKYKPVMKEMIPRTSRPPLPKINKLFRKLTSVFKSRT